MGKVLRSVIIMVLVFVVMFGNVNSYVAYTKGEPVKVGIFDMEGFHHLDENGNPVGFCIDYLKVIADVNGWTYEFVEVEDFKDGLQKLTDHEIDLLAPAMMTDERRENYLYSELYFGTEYSVFLTLHEREDLFYQDYASFNGLKVAVLEGYPMTDYFISKMQAYDFDVELCYYANSEDGSAALNAGEVDALVTSSMYYDESFKVLDRFYPQPFYFISCKENVELMKELNGAMERVQETYPSLLEELLYTHYPVYEQQFYTKEELRYMEMGKTLRVAYVADRKPLSYTNEEGELAGISRELFDQISEISGLQFEYVELPEGAITYEYLQEQKIDLLTGVEYNSANMSSAGIVLSRPYVKARKVLVSRSEFSYAANETYTLAVVEGSKTFNDVVVAKYPNMEIKEYKTVEECFLALYREEVDLLLQNQYVVEALMGKPMYSSFTVLPIEGLADELCFSTVVPLNGGYGISEEESSIIVGILNKAISQISDVEVDNMVVRVMVEDQYDLEFGDFLYSYRFTITAVFCAMIALSVLAMVYQRQKRLVQAIEEEERRLKELQQKRYKTIIDCSDDMIYEITIDGKSSMGSDKIKEKFGWEIPKSAQTLDYKRAMEILHVHEEDEEIFRQSELDNGAEFDDLTLRLCKADGTAVWCRVSRTVLKDQNNRAVSILGKIVDVDEEVKEKQILEHRVRVDQLTGLLNKQAFENEVREYVEAHPTESACFVFIDMDHFKEINDNFGHTIGDDVIKENARKIQLLFKNFDCVGRFGGDEFCVFVKDIPMATLIDRLQFAVKKMEQTYTYDGESVTISASIGAAYCKCNSIGYQELMEAADSAAYQAKDNGRNCYVIKEVE